MNQDTLSKVADAAGANGLDAIIAASPENFAYLAGFVVPSHPVLRWRHAMLVVKPDASVAALAVDIEQSTVERALPGVPLKVWAEFTDNPIVELVRLITELSLSARRIGIETDYLPARDFDQLRRALPQAQFIPAQDLFNRARMIKTEREIALLRNLSRIGDQSIAGALGPAVAGTSEMRIAASLTRGIYEHGADAFRFMTVATGERSQLANVGPTARILEARDICRVGVFAVLDGYHAGVCRTGYVTAAPLHAERLWSILSDATRMLLGAIRPGASTRDIFNAYLAKIAPLDMPPVTFAGHGIGLHLHEEPYLSAAADWELEAGMVLAIEPLIYRTGHGFGLQNKDMVAVTADGAELLSNATDTTWLVRCGARR